MLDFDKLINYKQYLNTIQSFLDKYFKTVKITNNSSPFAKTYTVLKTGATTDIGFNPNNIALAKLAGGEAISFICDGVGINNIGCIFAIDVNGPDGPNVTGRDLFAVSINGRTNQLFDNFAAADCGTKNFGYGCYTKLQEDNWEMKY